MELFLKVLFFLFLLKEINATNHQLKAFKNIAKALAASNHEVSVISVNGKSDFNEIAVLPNFIAQSVPYSIAAFENMNSPEYKGINTSSVIAFDSIDSLKIFNNETYTCNKPKFNNVTTLKSDYFYAFQFFVYSPGMTKSDIILLDDNPAPYNSIMLRYEYFIADEGDFINIWTFVWFTAEKCDKRQLELVNQFSKKTQEWKHDNFMIEKFANFHGCTLNFHFVEDYPNCIALSENKCIGYVCETVKVLAKRLDYTYTSYIQKENNKWSGKKTKFIAGNFDLRWLFMDLG